MEKMKTEDMGDWWWFVLSIEEYGKEAFISLFARSIGIHARKKRRINLQGAGAVGQGIGQ